LDETMLSEHADESRLERQLRALRLDEGRQSARPAGEPKVAVGGRRLQPGLVIAVSGTILAILLATSWGVVREEQVAPEQITASPRPAEAAQAPGGLVTSGFVVAGRQATVAADITGRVEKILVREGEQVRKGQVVAILDARLATSDFEESIDRRQSANANLAAISAQADEARTAYERTRMLQARGYATNAALSQSEAHMIALQAQRDSAVSDMRAAGKRVQRSRDQLGNYAIRAPFDGVVIGLNAQVGEIVSPISSGGGFTRTGICTLVDMASLGLQVEVAEAYISRVSVGQKGTATLDAYPDKQMPVTVAAIIPSVSREKATVAVRLDFQQPPERVFPNMSAKAALK
jgi:RND family efflux transporter MFP subunit